MGGSRIDDVGLAGVKDAYAEGDTVTARVRFAVRGGVREAFNEGNWTAAYDKNDNLFKIKYGIRLVSGGLRKKELGTPVDTYRKASIFWTRNPKLVNPVKERRIWVQVAKNFVPYIRLTEEEVRRELFDFDEEVRFKASELGRGRHGVGAEVLVSWQRHDYVDAGGARGRSREIELAVD